MQKEYNYEFIRRLEREAYELRKETLEMCLRGGTGHVSSSFSCAEILTVLYNGRVMRYDPKNPGGNERDRFILSKGHASPILYATLAKNGFFDKKWLATFNQKNGRFGVHLQNSGVPGVEFTAGALGYGIGYGNGTALTAKMDKKSYLTFVLTGDGELYEGSNWESINFAGHHGLNNLIVIVDRNGQCVTDFTENFNRLNPLDEKFRVHGWDVKNVDGHSIKELLNAFEGIRSYKRNRPYAIIAETIKGKGISYMENVGGWHAVIPKGEQAEQAKIELKRKIHELKLREKKNE